MVETTRKSGIRRSVSPPVTRRRFVHVWDEINYVLQKVTYWLYERGDAVRAARYRNRLENLVNEIGSDRVAIEGNLARALLAEMRGDIKTAIRCRERPLMTVERIFAKHQNTGARDDVVLTIEFAYALYGRLAELYAESGRRTRAVSALERYQRLCEHCGVKFPCSNLLRKLRMPKRGGASTPCGTRRTQ